MAELYCVVMVGCFVIRLIWGRCKVLPNYCSDVIISQDLENCMFVLDIPVDDISQYHKLILRVPRQEEASDV